MNYEWLHNTLLYEVRITIQTVYRIDLQHTTRGDVLSVGRLGRQKYMNIIPIHGGGHRDQQLKLVWTPTRYGIKRDINSFIICVTLPIRQQSTREVRAGGLNDATQGAGDFIFDLWIGIGIEGHHILEEYCDHLWGSSQISLTEVPCNT